MNKVVTLNKVKGTFLRMKSAFSSKSIKVPVLVPIRGSTYINLDECRDPILLEE